MGSQGLLEKVQQGQGEVVPEGDASRRQVYLAKDKVSGKKKMNRPSTTSKSNETQNVRGFVEVSRRKWMEAWKRTSVLDRPTA